MTGYLLNIKTRDNPFEMEEEYYLSLVYNKEEISMDFYLSLELGIDNDIYRAIKDKYIHTYNIYDCISYFYDIYDIINFKNDILEYLNTKK